MNMATLGDRHGSSQRLAGIQPEVTVKIQQVSCRQHAVTENGHRSWGTNNSSIFFSAKSRMTRGQAKKPADLFPRSEMGANETLRHH